MENYHEDENWPDQAINKFQQPGKVFYYKAEDLQVIDTWRL